MRKRSQLRSKRYHELTVDDLNVELQVHTKQTDGQSSILEILETAKARGLAAIAFTEHVRRDTTWFSQFASDVREAAQDYKDLAVYVGCEAKALDKAGTLDISDEIHEQCDLVLGSVHRFPAENGEYTDWDRLDNSAFALAEFELARGLLNSGRIHVLAHPGGMFQKRRRRPFPELYLREMMRTSIETGVAIEINTSYQVNLDKFLELCSEVNPYVSIGSDAHTLGAIGQCRDVLLSRRAGR
jgi:putative hydrolase